MRPIFFTLVFAVISFTLTGQSWQEQNNDNRGRQNYFASNGGNLGYSIRTNFGGGWAWQLVDGNNKSYFHVRYNDGFVGLEDVTDPTAPITFRNSIGPKLDLYYTQNNGGDRYGIQVHDSELRIHSGALGSLDGGITFGKSGNSTFTEYMRITNAGSIGIGTSTPNAPIHIKYTGSGSHLKIETDSNGQGDLQWWQGGSDIEHQRAALQIDNISGDFQGWVYDGIEWKNWLNVSRFNQLVTIPLGNVGIGTTPESGDKLAVDGKISSKEIQVEIAPGTGPDYVFERDYDLRSLEELQSQINELGHLPEIPSAKEMESEGVELGEMNMLLLKKIEELTLYQLQLLEMLKEQQKEITQLKSKQP